MRPGILLAGVAVLMCTARSAKAQRVDASSDTLAILNARIDQLDQQIRILARRAELQQEADSLRVASLPLITVASDGVTLHAADGGFQLKLRGYVHQDSRYYDAATPGGTSTLVLRRVRPIIEAASGPFSFRLMSDFGEGRTVLQDAHVDVAFSKSVAMRAGKFKPPVGYERLLSATAIRFVERAFPTALVPNRDLGVQLYGGFHNALVTYAVGVFNGVTDGSSADTDINDRKDFAGRVMLQPLSSVSVGVSASQGKSVGALGATGLGTYKSPGQLDFFAYRTAATAAGTVVANGTRTRISPQGSLYSGPIGVLGEYAVSKQAVVIGTTAEKLTHKAWDISAGYVLTGEANAINGVRPRAAANPSKGHWGAVELVARVHAINLDDAAFPVFADSTRSATAARAWAGGVNWYLNRNVKVVAQYEHTSFDGGSAAGDRVPENLVFARVQFAF